MTTRKDGTVFKNDKELITALTAWVETVIQHREKAGRHVEAQLRETVDAANARIRQLERAEDPFSFENLPHTLTDTKDRTWALEEDPSGALCWTRAGVAVYASPNWEGEKGVSFQFDVEDGQSVGFVVPWSVPQMFIGSDQEHYVAVCAIVLGNFA